MAKTGAEETSPGKDAPLLKTARLAKGTERMPRLPVLEFAAVVYLAARTQERACSRLFTVQSADQPHGSQKTPCAPYTYLFQESTKSVLCRGYRRAGDHLRASKDPQGRANSPWPIPKKLARARRSSRARRAERPQKDDDDLAAPRHAAARRPALAQA